MPPQSTVVINNIIACLKPVIPLLYELHDGLGTPFVQAISNTTMSLITALQNAKKNKEDCIQLTENIHGVIYAIVNLHVQSETAGSLPPATLKHVGRFTEWFTSMSFMVPITHPSVPRTLHKILAFVEAQQESNMIKHFFRQSEMNSLLKDCQTGLQEALAVLKIDSGATLNNIDDMQKKTQHMHEELLELISNLSDTASSDRASSLYNTLNNSWARPQIFHGRDFELTELVRMLCQETAKIAILGAGGMGKTSLAKATLHHPDVITKYEHRLFVPCDSATTNLDIAASIGVHLGLNPGRNLTKPVLHSLSGKPTCLLILDNLETAWEPLESRSSVEDLLSLLSDIPHLALMVTMRGAERPRQVKWTRPFPQPLGPLSKEAAREMFIEIADGSHEPREVDQLLHFTDNMPLAVDIIAHLVDYEGCAHILARWEKEKTSLLSAGHDKRSNLGASIALSISSPRLTSRPGAKDLLSLLSILPDGLSDAELVQSNIPISDVLASKTVLLGTSLAYLDDKKRLKSLVPIREYMQLFHPAAAYLVQPLQRHFNMLLDIYRKYNGSYQTTGMMTDITLNLGNIHYALQQALTPQNPDLVEAIRCTLSLNAFSRLRGQGWHALMDSIQAILPASDHKLKVQFIIEVFNSSNSHAIEDPELLASEARSHMLTLNDLVLESRLYRAMGTYYAWFSNNQPEGLRCFEKALLLAQDANDISEQSRVIINPAIIKWSTGEYNTGQALAREARKLAKLCGNYYDQANALRIEAMCCQNLGNIKHSLLLLQAARDLLMLCGMSQCTIAGPIWITEAETHLQKSEYAEARTIYTKIAQQTSQEQQREDFPLAMMNIAELDMIIGANEQDVLQSLEKAKESFGSVGFFAGDAFCDMILASLNLREGNILAAEKLFQECLHWSWTKHAEVSIYCLEKMADINRWGLARFDWTSTSSMVYLAFAHKSQQKFALYKAFCFLGDVFILNNDESTAENLLTVALEAFTYMDVHRSRADCMRRLGDIARQRGDIVGAAVLWRQARPLFERSLQAQDVVAIDVRLEGIKAA